MTASRWERLLDVYDEVASSPVWAHLRKTGMRLVRGDGPETAERARILAVGEAPGAQENGKGKPFVGASGVMLERLLESAGLSREQIFLTNTVKYRPLGNRTPTAAEIENGRVALRQEWKIIRPRLTIAIGHVATDALAASAEARRNHGVPVAWDGGWLVVMYHPAFGLHNHKARSWIEQEWATLGRILRGNNSPLRRRS